MYKKLLKLLLISFLVTSVIFFVSIFFNKANKDSVLVENVEEVIENKESIEKPYIKINDTAISVEIANTEATRRLGLSHRESLDYDSGMIFVLPGREIASFWMKDMKISLDMIWVDGNKIINISKNVPPAGSNPDITYSSEFPVDHVLEVNGGFCNKENIQVGDLLEFNL